MSQQEKNFLPSAIAAVIILAVFGAAFYFLPFIMIGLGGISPWLAAAVGACFVLGFFLIFWLRSRYQRGREG